MVYRTIPDPLILKAETLQLRWKTPHQPPHIWRLKIHEECTKILEEAGYDKEYSCTIETLRTAQGPVPKTDYTFYKHQQSLATIKTEYGFYINNHNEPLIKEATYSAIGLHFNFLETTEEPLLKKVKRTKIKHNLFNPTNKPYSTSSKIAKQMFKLESIIAELSQGGHYADQFLRAIIQTKKNQSNLCSFR